MTAYQGFPPHRHQRNGSLSLAVNRWRIVAAPSVSVTGVHLHCSAEEAYCTLMPTATYRWLRADLARMPEDGNRYEVLDGALFVTPQAGFPHQWIAAQLMHRLAPYVGKHALGVAVGPGAVVFNENELRPDVLVVPPPFAHFPEKWESLPYPILVAEVLSNSTRHRDLRIKPSAYLSLGIPEYWVVDRFRRCVLVWKAGANEADVVTTTLRWTPRQNVEPLLIPIVDILPSADAPQAGDSD
jgi:Uma2 family endonuclease